MKKLLLLLLSLGIIGSAYADWKDGYLAYEKGDYVTAFAVWEPLAEQENIGAQIQLILMYTEGTGVEKDLTKANYWTARRDKAALYLIEESTAMTDFYSFYREGDYAAAFEELVSSAVQGYPLAQLNLGNSYAHGNDLASKDMKRAKFWIQKAFNNPFKSNQKHAKETWDEYELWKY